MYLDNVTRSYITDYNNIINDYINVTWKFKIQAKVYFIYVDVIKLL